MTLKMISTENLVRRILTLGEETPEVLGPVTIFNQQKPTLCQTVRLPTLKHAESFVTTLLEDTWKKLVNSIRSGMMICVPMGSDGNPQRIILSVPGFILPGKKPATLPLWNGEVSGIHFAGITTN